MPTTKTPAQIADFDFAFKTRLRDRDPEAMTLFFDTYFDRVFNRVHHLIRNRQVAEDLTQDIFLKVHRGLSRLDPKKNIKPWIATILNNHLRDYWRSQNTNRVRQSLEVISESLEDPSQPLTSNLERKEMEASLRRCIYRLPMTMRSVLLLRIFDDLSFVQIARITGLTAGAARKRYSRAINELRDLLPAEDSALRQWAHAG